MRVEESIFIQRPAEDVFRFFDDRGNDGRWMATVHESEWLDPGGTTAVGRRGRWSWTPWVDGSSPTW